MYLRFPSSFLRVDLFHSKYTTDFEVCHSFEGQDHFHLLLVPVGGNRTSTVQELERNISTYERVRVKAVPPPPFINLRVFITTNTETKDFWAFMYVSVQTVCRLRVPPVLVTLIKRSGNPF